MGAKPGTIRATLHKTKVVHKKGNGNKALFAKKQNKKIFALDIKENEKFHKDDAMAWAKDQNWERMQEEFERKGPNGVFIYKSIDMFAKFQSRNNEDVERWIKKSIGPVPKKEIEWKGDWAMERVVEYSKDLEHTKLLKEQLSRDSNTFKLCLPVAGSYRSWQLEILELKQAIKKLVGNELVEDPPEDATEKEKAIWFKEQEARLKFYMDWIERLHEYKAKIDRNYLKALGFDKPNFVSMAQSLIVNPGSESGERTRDDLAEGIAAVMRMEIEKARIFENPLPEDYQKLLEEKPIIEIEAKEVSGNGKGKVKVH